MVLNILSWALSGMTVWVLTLCLRRLFRRRGWLTERHLKPVRRASGVVLVIFGLIVAVYAFNTRPVAGGLSALLYVLIGVLLVFGKPQPAAGSSTRP